MSFGLPFLVEYVIVVDQARIGDYPSSESRMCLEDKMIISEILRDRKYPGTISWGIKGILMMGLSSEIPEDYLAEMEKELGFPIKLERYQK